MKKLIFIFLTAITFYCKAQKLNDKVQVEHAGIWYDATILKANTQDGKFYIKYDGWDDTWNEWISPDRIKGRIKEKPKSPLIKFSVGDHVEVEYGMVPEPATIIEVGENKYHIKYDKTVFGDKWVTVKQIKKL